MPNICTKKFSNREVPCGRKLGMECISERDCEFQEKVGYIPFPDYLVFDPGEWQEIQ